MHTYPVIEDISGSLIGWMSTREPFNDRIINFLVKQQTSPVVKNDFNMPAITKLPESVEMKMKHQFVSENLVFVLICKAEDMDKLWKITGTFTPINLKR